MSGALVDAMTDAVASKSNHNNIRNGCCPIARRRGLLKLHAFINKQMMVHEPSYIVLPANRVCRCSGSVHYALTAVPRTKRTTDGALLQHRSFLSLPILIAAAEPRPRVNH